MCLLYNISPTVKLVCLIYSKAGYRSKGAGVLIIFFRCGLLYSYDSIIHHCKKDYPHQNKEKDIEMTLPTFRKISGQIRFFNVYEAKKDKDVNL